MRIALVIGLSALMVPSASDASLPRVPAPTQTQPREPAATPAPKPLSGATRLRRANALARKLDQKAIARLVDGQRLAPLRPELESGARINWASDVDFIGARLAGRHGAFSMKDYEGSTNLLRSIVQMQWPTEVGKLYVVDCSAIVHYMSNESVNAETQAYVEIEVQGGGTQKIRGRDGHVVHAFVAGANPSVMELRPINDADLAWYWMSWHGCELLEAV